MHGSHVSILVFVEHHLRYVHESRVGWFRAYELPNLLSWFLHWVSCHYHFKSFGGLAVFSSPRRANNKNEGKGTPFSYLMTIRSLLCPQEFMTKRNDSSPPFINCTFTWGVGTSSPPAFFILQLGESFWRKILIVQFHRRIHPTSAGTRKRKTKL